MLNSKSNKKGFLSFLLVLVLSSTIMVSLFVYSLSYNSQSYHKALVAEKMYYLTLDAKHAVGEFATTGLWVGTIIYISRLSTSIADCVCSVGDLAAILSYLGAPVSGGTAAVLGAMIQTVCHLQSNVGLVFNVDTLCDVNTGDISGDFLDVDPILDLKRGVSLMLFVDEVVQLSDLDNQQKVFYYCADDDVKFMQCSKSIVSSHDLITGNPSIDSFKDLFGSTQDCKLFYLTGSSLNPLDLAWESTCDNNFDISITGNAYEGIKKSLYSNQTFDSEDFSTNIKFTNFGVGVYDVGTQSLTVSKMPEKSFSMSKSIDVDLVSLFNNDLEVLGKDDGILKKDFGEYE